MGKSFYCVLEGTCEVGGAGLAWLVWIISAVSGPQGRPPDAPGVIRAGGQWP